MNRAGNVLPKPVRKVRLLDGKEYRVKFGFSALALADDIWGETGGLEQQMVKIFGGKNELTGETEVSGPLYRFFMNLTRCALSHYHLTEDDLDDLIDEDENLNEVMAAVMEAYADRMRAKGLPEENQGNLEAPTTEPTAA